jgi:NitT/TauT family transport system ATP-binding protein
MLPKVEIVNLNKSFYKDGVEIKVLDNINLKLYDGEFVSIIGPSGCGKSTIFSIICNLQNQDSGDIIVDGKKDNINKRFAYMPQKDLLFPWRKLKDNMILPLEIQGEDKNNSYKKVDSLFDQFGLSGFENAYPNELSGGMKQRAALLRTFLIDSDIMLLDEPFGAIDAINRDKLQVWLLDVWSKFKRSVFFITHSIDEAIYLSDRIYVLSDRPASVKLEIKIDLERPRDKKIITSQKFMDYKACLLSALE